MANSRELRQRARNSLKGKFGTAVLVCFIASIVYSTCMGLAGGMSGIDKYVSELIKEVSNGTFEVNETFIAALIGFLVFCFVALLINIAIAIFVYNPLNVGVASFFIKNRESAPGVGEMTNGFKSGYGANVKVMFLADLKASLWSLLFIIPGIVKGIEYSILPYILAENPNISSAEAFAKAKELMKGNRWKCFKLSLSFLGWMFLSLLTLGIGFIFLTPYMQAASAEFYNEVSSK